MSYYRICPNCGKGTVARYATDDSLCGECSDIPATTDKLSAEKLQEQLNTAKKALTEIIFFSQGCYDSKYFASIAQKALAAIGGEDEL